ncbi:MAG: sigma-54 interaction domain-containing protein [Vicinamibacterales bacterium]
MLVGRSQGIQEVRAQIARVGPTAFTVLVTGESGTGKELVARSVHMASGRRGPFIAVNCAALVESLLETELFGIEDRTATGVRGRRGKFELAEGGTLFLDEVGDLSLPAQAKLLRVLQDMSVERVGAARGRAVDTRVIAATNRDLPGMVAQGVFRGDLYYRVSGVELHVPPLRTRRDDVPLLIDHLLMRHRRVRRLAVSETAIEAMWNYDWPGNVRQLERVLERAVALAPTPRVELSDLPEAIRAPYGRLLEATPEQHTLRAFTSRYVRLVLARCNGNKRKACEELAISYHTLRAHLAYGARGGRMPHDAGDPQV